MAVLWFARKGLEATSGFAAYELPIQNFAATLDERTFQFLSPLHGVPVNSLGRSEQAVDYRFVLLEVGDAEAKVANWRAGFYKIAFSPVEVVRKLGKPHAPLRREQTG